MSQQDLIEKYAAEIMAASTYKDDFGSEYSTISDYHTDDILTRFAAEIEVVGVERVDTVHHPSCPECDMHIAMDRAKLSEQYAKIIADEAVAKGLMTPAESKKWIAAALKAGNGTAESDWPRKLYDAVEKFHNSVNNTMDAYKQKSTDLIFFSERDEAAAQEELLHLFLDIKAVKGDGK